MYTHRQQRRTYARAPVIRGDWRLADLKVRQPTASRLMNVKISADVAGTIDRVATTVKVSKTEVTALLSEGLTRAAKRSGTPFLLLLALLMPLAAHARTMCMILVHGKGLYDLVDPGWAADYWMNGQFQSVAQPCGGMPVLITHADGTYGQQVAFDRAYCGCGITRWNGCDYVWVPQAGKTDPGITGPWPAGWWNGWVNTTNANADNPDPTNQCVRAGPYWPRAWPVPGQYQGVMEQINTFLDQTGCTDAYVVTHSNGGNVMRTGLSLMNLYLGSNCRQNKKSTGTLDPGCATRRQHQLRVHNAISHVLMLHPPSLGSEAADKAASLSGSWYTGWVLDWIGEPYDKSTQELTTSAMYMGNLISLYGTTNPLRPWPAATSDGIPLHSIRWITMASHLHANNNEVDEENGHTADWQLEGLALYVQFPNDYSDGMVSWPSQVGVYSNSSTDIWYFTGQHDQAAAAMPQGSYVGNNHYHAKLGAAGGGRWRPLYWYQQPTYTIPGISPPLAGIGCWQQNENGTLVTYCYGWPSSGWRGLPVQVCPDALCKWNQVRGSPAGGDEAFTVGAFIQAKAAYYCGPAIQQQSVFNGSYVTVYRLQYGGPGLFNPYWQPVYQLSQYDTYYPNAGMGICNWAC
jgi:hypothetical protein